MYKSKSIRDVTCPECGKVWRLVFDYYGDSIPNPCRIGIASCDSGGIYECSITCEDCGWSEDLRDSKHSGSRF